LLLPGIIRHSLSSTADLLQPLLLLLLPPFPVHLI
jgi:hypothetical protein